MRKTIEKKKSRRRTKQAKIEKKARAQKGDTELTAAKKDISQKKKEPRREAQSHREDRNIPGKNNVGENKKHAIDRQRLPIGKKNAAAATRL